MKISFFLGSPLNQVFSTLGSANVWQVEGNVIASSVEFLNSSGGKISSFSNGQKIDKIRYFFTSKKKQDHFLFEGDITVESFVAQKLTVSVSNLQISHAYQYGIGANFESFLLYKFDSKDLENFDEEIFFQGDVNCFNRIGGSSSDVSKIYAFLEAVRENFRILSNNCNE